MYRQQQFEALLANRRILIAGYGREGKSTHTLLQRYAPMAQVTVAENDEAIRNCLLSARQKGQQFDLVFKSPGIPTMKFDGLCDLNTLTSQTDLFLQLYADHTIGITGTKGKSTTATLIYHIAHVAMPKVLLAGNMGIPLFDIVDQLDERTLVVAELSCHQLENIHRAPHIGVILNLYQEHLDHYPDYTAYQMAKMQMALRQQEGDHCFYCADNQDLVQRIKCVRNCIPSTLHPYTLTEAREEGVAQLPSVLQGDHNVSNIYVARLVTRQLGINDEQFADALATFQGLPHRLQKVGTFRGITFYNDSISTIPQATIAAVEALAHVDTLILGGYDRGIDYQPLYAYLSDGRGSRIRNITFVGEAGRRMTTEWPQCMRRNTFVSNDYKAIVDWCYRHTAQGAICLLSPAAASYDQFKNFEERGDTYKQLVCNHR